MDDGSDESTINSNSHTDIGILEPSDGVPMPLNIDIRVISQCQSHGLDDDVINTDLSAILLLIFVEFGPQGNNTIHFNGNSDIVVRNGLFRLGQSICNGLSHA